MPITIKNTQMRYKGSDGEYVGVDVIAERTTAQQVAEIEAKAEEVIDSIPKDYTELDSTVRNKLDKPTNHALGIEGQILRLDKNGETKWDNVAVSEEIADNVKTWIRENISGDSTVVIDKALKTEDAAADAKATGDRIGEIKDDVNELMTAELMIPSSTADGWRLNESDGLCSSEAEYRLVKYQVTPETLIKVISDDRFQFQIDAYVPIEGDNNRVGVTYVAGTYNIKVPANAAYLILSTPIEQSKSLVYALNILGNLTDIQTESIRTNLGLDNIDSLTVGNVKYDREQTLDENFKQQARSNIGAAPADIVTVNGGRITSTEVDGQTVNYLQLTQNNTDVGNPIELPEGGGSGLAFDSGYVSNEETIDGVTGSFLHLTQDGENIEGFTPFLIPAGSGGGGQTGNAIVLSNVMRVSSVRNGAEANFSFTATSMDDYEITAHWLVNNREITQETHDSGSVFSFQAGQYLNSNDNKSVPNTVQVILTSPTGGYLNRPWTVTCVPFNIKWSSSMDTIILQTVDRDVSVFIDVMSQATKTNVVSVYVGDDSSHYVNREVTGSDTITIQLDRSWFETGANTISAVMRNAEDTEPSETIYMSVLWAINATKPIVAFSEETAKGEQYDIIPVYYMAYTPNSETTLCSIQIGNEPATQVEVGRSKQQLDYVANTKDDVVITLTSVEDPSVSDSIGIVVTESRYTIGIVTDGLVYNLDPAGHSNNETDRDSFGGMTLRRIGSNDNTSFDWINGGFHTDEDGPAFVVKKGYTASLPRSLFEDDDEHGKMINLSFKIKNSERYDAVAMRDLNTAGSRGIYLQANKGELRMGSTTEFRYCEESRIDLCFMAEPPGNAQSVVTIWMDGLPSSVSEYTSQGLIQQENPLIIGSEHCDVWIYGIRCYNGVKNEMAMVQNYISNGVSVEDKKNRYISNSIYDKNAGNAITPDSLHDAAPDLTIITLEAVRMTKNKEDPIPVKITIRDGDTVLIFPAAESINDDGKGVKGAIYKVQGTSSAAYGRSSFNMDMDFSKCATYIKDNTEIEGKPKYKISESSIPVNYLNIKVNVASSENANNVCTVDWYNTYQPFLTEHRNRPGARDVIEAKPCAVFFTNPGDETIWVSSQQVGPGETILYAMGDLCNSKKNTDVFGQDGKTDEYVTHPTLACIEDSGNDTAAQRFTEVVFFNSDENAWCTENGIDTETGKMKYITHFEWRMKPSSENKSMVVDSWTNTLRWVVGSLNNPSKPTEFHDHLADYFSVDSLLYHYLMIEFFAAYDNVCKNTFYSYDWDPNADDGAGAYRWNIKCAYDWDTILACDNDGKPLGDYGIDYGDQKESVGSDSNRYFFNDEYQCPIWKGIKTQFQPELRNMYKRLKSLGAWDGDAIAQKWLTYQNKRPRATMIRDAYIKYVYPFQTRIDADTGYDRSYLSRMNGSKVYQRKQFLTYQTDYMDGKYRFYTKPDSVAFRANTTGSQVFEVKSYAKTYITIQTDTSVSGSIKVGEGEIATFDNPPVSVGGNATLYVTPDRLIQYIRPLNETKNSTFTSSGAYKLMEVNLGGDTVNEQWDNREEFGTPSPILKEVSLRNLTQFSKNLNFSENTELRSLDTRNTNTGEITFAPYSPLESIQLNSCTSLTMRNISGVSTFTMESGDNLEYVLCDGCDESVTTPMATLEENGEYVDGYLTQSFRNGGEKSRYVRLTNVNWYLEDTYLLNELLKAKAINADGTRGSAPCVLTGTVIVAKAKRSELDAYAKAWPSGSSRPTVDALVPQEEVPIRFFDWNADFSRDEPLYTVYIAVGEEFNESYIEDVPIPERQDTEQTRYSFKQWNGLPTVGDAVYQPYNVRAEYNETPQTYSVIWYDGIGTFNEGYGRELYRIEDVTYGESVTPEEPIPTYTSAEAVGQYFVFDGWDRSTGFVHGNTRVKAKWTTGSVPLDHDTYTLGEVGTQGHFNWAQIKAIADKKRCDEFFQPKEHMDFTIGHDFNYDGISSNEPGYVESYEFVNEPLFLDGSGVVIFNGQNGRKRTQLFNGSIQRFTLAIEFEFSSDTGTLVSCIDKNGNYGFEIYRENNYAYLRWGDKRTVLSQAYARSIVVIRYNHQYPYTLYVAFDGATLNENKNVYGALTAAYMTNKNHKDSNQFYDIYTRQMPEETQQYLAFGGLPAPDGTDSVSTRGTGTIYWAKIWYDDLGENDVKTLAIFPHLKQRFNYTGMKYNDYIGTLNTASGDFMCDAGLPYYKRLREDASNMGGWGATSISTWLNGQYFKALPIQLQQIINDVEIKTLSGTDTQGEVFSTTVSTMSKVYIRAQAEVFTNPSYSSYYASERPNTAPYVVSYYLDYNPDIGQIGNNQSRIIFGDYILPDDTNYIALGGDPTTPGLSGYIIRSGKTVWINTAHYNYCYLYFDSDYLEQHKMISGSNISSEINVDAAGADSDGKTGGKWIRASVYWLRSPYQAYTSYYQNMGPDGAGYYVTGSGGASSAYWCMVPCFSI